MKIYGRTCTVTFRQCGPVIDWQCLIKLSMTAAINQVVLLNMKLIYIAAITVYILSNFSETKSVFVWF